MGYVPLCDCLFCHASSVALGAAQSQNTPVVRARDLAVPFDGIPGPLNAITDVAGVEVGATTIIRGDGAL